MEPPYNRERKCENGNIAGEICDCRNLVHDIDVGYTTSHLGRFRTPIIRNWNALEDGGKENADPPAKHIDTERVHPDSETASGEDANVKCEDRGFDHGHCACVEYLHGEHDLTLRLQLFCHRESDGLACGAVDFMFADASDSNPNDVVDGDAEREYL